MSASPNPFPFGHFRAVPVAGMPIVGSRSDINGRFNVSGRRNIKRRQPVVVVRTGVPVDRRVKRDRVAVRSGNINLSLRWQTGHKNHKTANQHTHQNTLQHGCSSIKKKGGVTAFAAWQKLNKEHKTSITIFLCYVNKTCYVYRSAIFEAANDCGFIFGSKPLAFISPITSFTISFVLPISPTSACIYSN